MSVIDGGMIYNTVHSINARGGTEQMRDHLLRCGFDLSGVTVFCSRLTSREFLNNDKKKIFWFHDLPGDPGLWDVGLYWNQIDHFVFVSNWQKEAFREIYDDLFDKHVANKCTVIANFVETPEKIEPRDESSTIRAIYHTTPHRGLTIACNAVDNLHRDGVDIHLDVFSSYAVYGQEDRDYEYRWLYALIDTHPAMTYHGYQPHDVLMPVLGKSDIFIYPSIWEETSCLAMMEALVRGVTPIHPNLGALCETANGHSRVIGGDMSARGLMMSTMSVVHDLIEHGEIKRPGLTSPTTWAIGNGGFDRFKAQWGKILKEI